MQRDNQNLKDVNMGIKRRYPLTVMMRERLPLKKIMGHTWIVQRMKQQPKMFQMRV